MNRNFGTFGRQVALALIFVALFVQPVRAKRMAPEVVNPKTYTSPSGAFALAVDPSELYGQGPASYRLTRNGKEIWSATHPFTFLEVVVTDDGTVAGYAYEYGEEGFPPGGRGADEKAGKFYVAILAPHGKLRQVHMTERHDTRILHDVPQPLATGMFVEPTQKRLVVRVRNPDLNGAERWRTFDLTNGAELAAADIPDMGRAMRWVMDARFVAGTPLVLVHWWHYDDAAKKNPGGAFTLVDLNDPKKPVEVWRHVLAGDYHAEDTKENPYASNHLHDRIQKNGPILRCDQPNRFDLHHVADKKRVTFEAARDASRWIVREVARAGYEMPAEEAVEQKELATVTLRPLGELKLTAPKPASKHPARNVWGFDVDDRGRIGFIRGESGTDAGRCSFVLLDDKGNVAIDATQFLAAAGPEASSQQKIAWLHADRWVITDSDYSHDAVSRAWFADVDVKKRRANVRRIDDFQAPSVESLVSTRDGGFVALCNHRQKYTSTHELIRFDKTGARKWIVTGDSRDDSVLFSPADVAFDSTGGGSIAVLDRIRKVIQVVDLDGKAKRRIDLAKSFGKEPNYPTRINATSNGMLLVHDFNGTPPMWRLKNDGTRVDNFTPRFPDERVFGVHDIRIGPESKVWVSDAAMIVRLDAKGVVDLAFGDPPDAESAGDVGATALGRDGRVYMASSRGGAVQVFDPSGKLLRTLKPLPKDFESNDGPSRLTVDGNGDVYLATSMGEYLHIKADGTRVGWEKRQLDTITEEWIFQPATRKRWVAGYHQMWLVDESGKVVRGIRRQPDNNWLSHPREMAVAPDGSLAVCSTNRARRHVTDARLNIYSAAGEPVRTISIPFGDLNPRVAFDGRRAVVTAGANLLLADARDGSLRWLKFSKPVESSKEPYFQPFFSPDGRELWLVDRNQKSKPIQRYVIEGG